MAQRPRWLPPRPLRLGVKCSLLVLSLHRSLSIALSPSRSLSTSLTHLTSVPAACDTNTLLPLPLSPPALLRFSFRRDVPASEIVEGLVERASTSKSWVGAAKALVVLHRLMRDAHEVGRSGGRAVGRSGVSQRAEKASLQPLPWITHHAASPLSLLLSQRIGHYISTRSGTLALYGYTDKSAQGGATRAAVMPAYPPLLRRAAHIAAPFSSSVGRCGHVALCSRVQLLP